MILLQWSRKIFTVLVLALVLTLATACLGSTQAAQTTTLSAVIGSRMVYKQLEQGSEATGQDFGKWVVQQAKGLVQEAYVRDNNQLHVVLTPQARTKEVQPLVRSLVQGFQNSFPNRDLTVLMYSPNKQLILTAQVDDKSNIKLTLH